jgi:hypothetical protein
MYEEAREGERVGNTDVKSVSNQHDQHSDIFTVTYKRILKSDEDIYHF